MSKRVNGWTWPPHYRQLIIIIYVLCSLVYFILIPWRIGVQSSTIAHALFGIWKISSFWGITITGLTLMSSNPADPAVVSSQHNIHPETSKADMDAESRFCTVCLTYVHHTSLHCRYCNKCVLNIDHHCFFVNNCIGKRNYRLFVATLLFMANYALGNLMFTIWALAWPYVDSLRMDSIVKNYGLAPWRLQTLTGFFALLHLLFVCFTFDLLRLHVLLWYKGMTTLQYAKFLRKQEENGGSTCSATCFIRLKSIQGRQSEQRVSPNNFERK
ncbi:DHHC palmitoyltransferase-domain-containing protein [Chytridium lagenaria]|nr:DHHC palmitoyltransferase-domain-containing protein [Chytridium lagenaria]